MCQKKYKTVNLLGTVGGDIVLTILRNKDTDRQTFGENVKKIGIFLANQLAENIKTKTVPIKTPIAPTTGKEFAEKILLVPVLRAGMGMMPGFLYFFEFARIGTVGFKRNENKRGEISVNEYQWELPKIEKEEVIIIIDPMVATGMTARSVITKMQKNYPKNLVYYVSIVMSEKSVETMVPDFPKVIFWTVVIDSKLNKNSYIVPGLGDAGDRLFNEQK